MNSYVAVIPVHNGERTIFQTLCSLDRQTVQPQKIQIFDNCSSDSTLSEVQKFKQVSTIPIHVERSEIVLPPHESFARSIAKIEGRFCWLAADDMLFPRSVERMLNARCSATCQHSLGGSTLFVNDDGEIIPGKIFDQELDCIKFLRDPADNSLFYGIHEASVVRKYLPKASSPAWDWSFSFQCARNGIHICGPQPLLLREYTPMEVHRANVLSQKSIQKYFPYLAISKSILTNTDWREKLQVIGPLFILNTKGYLFFNKHSPMIENFTAVATLLKYKRSSKNLRSWAKENSLVRAVHKNLPNFVKNTIRKPQRLLKGELTLPAPDLRRLYDENEARSRGKLLSIDNPLENFYCIPSNEFTTSQILEIICFFLKYARDKSELAIDLRNVNIDIKFLETIILGVNRIFPNGKILFATLKKKGEFLETIEDFYGMIWARNFSQDLVATFDATALGKYVKNQTVSFFLPEIPQPNRDAGSIDAVYLLSILKRLEVKTIVYVPHLYNSNPIALAMLSQLSEVASIGDFRNQKGLHVVYGPYAYQSFAPFLVDNNFVYIMIDAVFRRAEQNKNNLSIADKQILSSEKFALQNCKYALCISETDRSYVSEKFPSTRSIHFPIMRFVHSKSKEKKLKPKNLLFIGSLVHTPNKLAADWIVKHFAPKLLSVNPEIKIVLAGVGTDGYGRDEINVVGLGQVADLRSLYADSFASIAPMKVASGINGKVVESLCFSVPPIVSEAVSINLPSNLLSYCEVAQSVDEYAIIADRIFNNPKNYQQRHCDMKEVNGASNIKTIIELLRDFQESSGR